LEKATEAATVIADDVIGRDRDRRVVRKVRRKMNFQDRLYPGPANSRMTRIEPRGASVSTKPAPSSALESEEKSILDVAQDCGRYSVGAFEFLREGLDYTVQRKHGPSVENLRKILEWLVENDREPSELGELYEKDQLPRSLMQFIDKIGGLELAQAKLNLHVDGADLCWGLRDLALERWGLMAPAVLAHWGVQSTRDFGKMVFALVESGLLQKQSHDQIEDFNHVFDFREVFDAAYEIKLPTKGEV
jgi:uncharacterized repeat protein (TIGR04138 family)